MLGFVATDAAVSQAALERLVADAAAGSFNRVSVDGDTSTNDSFILLATGAARRSDRSLLREAVLEVSQGLAQSIVRDGEGATKFITVRVEKGRNEDECASVAYAIAHSPLVKTAWAGADPNWGRILAAAGRSGVALDPRRINIFFGDLQVCRGGVAATFDEREAHAYLTQPQYDVRVQLGRGRASLDFLTCDLTTEYVHINADYTT